MCQLLRRQIATYALSILGGFLVASGCSKTYDRAQAVVRIGYQKTGTLNLIRLRGTLAADLARLGVQVEWIGFPAGPQLLEALNAGAIDFGHAGTLRRFWRRRPACRLYMFPMSRRGRSVRRSS